MGVVGTFSLLVFACSKEMDIGAGNTVFPLLAMNKNPYLSLRAYDYSAHAVKLVQVWRVSNGLI